MAKLQAKVTADISGFSAAMKKCQGIARSLQPVMTGIGVVAAGAMAAVTAAAVGIKHALDIGGELSELSARTGVAAGDLSVLQMAFERAGIGADAVGPMINRMQKAIAGAGEGGKEAQDALARIGLSAEQLAGMSPDKQFAAIGKAIGTISDPAAQAAASMAIFGKSGGQMLALFKDGGGLSDAARAVGGQAALLTKNANMFDRASDILNTSGNKLQGLFVGMADEIVPALMPLLDELDGIDLSGIGQQLGHAAAIFITAITDGKIWELIGTSAQIAIRGATNNIWATLQGVGAALPQILTGNAKMFVTLMGLLTKSDFWLGLLQALVGAAQKFGAIILGAIAAVIEKLSSIPGMGFMSGAASSARNLANNADANANANLSAGGSKLGPMVDEVVAQGMQNLRDVGAAFVDGVQNATQIFDNTDLQDKLNATIDGLEKTVAEAQAAAAAKYKATTTQTPDGEGMAGMADKGKFGPLFASSLAKIGGGGFAVGGGNSLLDENRKQTNYLRKIADAIGGGATPALA